MTDRIDAAIEISRRRFLAGSAMVGFTAFLAACAPAATQTPAATTAATQAPGATPGPTAAPGTVAPPQITGPLNFANWDAYIDLTEVGDGEYDLPSPTLDDFKALHGVDVNYANAEIDGNDSFMATITPQLQGGVDPGWDLIVLTDWMAAKVIAAGWAEKINPDHIPTALANVVDHLRGLAYDPDLTYHMPWQSGATGLGYNSESTGRALTKFADLFDPAFAGKITLLDDSRDTFPLMHLMLQAQGKASANQPENMNVADAVAVHAYLKPFNDNGHIRAFRGNAYLQDFGSGDTWAAMVWSGDLASSGGENDVFVYPEEGANLWTDNMLIPKGAKNKYTAELMIDFVYDVDRAARLANFIYYISPVKGVPEAILKLDPELEGNELLFPPADVVARLHPQPQFDEATEAKVNELYADLAGV